MSYILEALKKADRERTAGHVPDLETVHRHQPTPRKSRRWLWVLAALVVSNAVFVALLATRHDVGRDGEDVALRTVPGERVARQPDPARSDAPLEAPPPVHLPPANVARVAPRAAAPGSGTVAPAPAPAARPAIARNATAVAPAENEPSSESAAPAIPSAAPSQANTSPGIPEWDELSLDFRSGLPMPRMDVHVYDPDPRRRFVLIDLQKFREGERLPNGALLEKIVPDGIVLSYQGTRFHYGK